MAVLNVLVTGATGFVGSALVGHLSNRGYRVRAAVRRLTPGLEIEIPAVDVLAVKGRRS